MNVYMTRQPIFDRDGNVFAYELLYRVNGETTAHNVNSEDTPPAETVFGIDIKDVVGKARAYINFASDLLIRGAARSISPEALVVEVLENQLEDELVLNEIQNLKERGYLIALAGAGRSDEPGELLSNCDLVRIDIKQPQKTVEKTAYVCRYSNKLMLAENVETPSDFECAKKLGCTYMRGYYFARPAANTESNIQPLPVNLMSTMQLMASPEPEIKDIVDVMSRDAAMCQRILRLINSVYFGVSSRVSSINQAILILGLDYLREWVYLMGMQKISQNDNMELMKLSLLLAKFSRGLSELVPAAENQGEAFYLMGLLSMMVFSGERFLAQALDEFPLTNDIKKGLLRRGGMYSDVFEMALFYSDGKWEEFDNIAEKYRLSADEVSELFAKCIREIENMNIA